MTTADAPEMLKGPELPFTKTDLEGLWHTGWDHSIGGFQVDKLARQGIAAHLWRDVATDLAAKLAAAEEGWNAACETAKERRDEAFNANARADRAEAALVAAQEKNRQLVTALDDALGTPCEQIRHQQELVATQEAMRESCASVADKCAAQNKEQHVKASRRASRLGADPFGHGEASHYAASELISCAAEAEAVAAMIRALPIPAAKPEGE